MEGNQWCDDTHLSFRSPEHTDSVGKESDSYGNTLFPMVNSLLPLPTTNSPSGVPSST